MITRSAVKVKVKVKVKVVAAAAAAAMALKMAGMVLVLVLAVHQWAEMADRRNPYRGEARWCTIHQDAKFVQFVERAQNKTSDIH